MKAYKYILTSVVAAMIMMLSGCTTTEKFQISTIPNTQVYLPQDSTPYITTNQLGDASFRVSSNKFIGYVNVKEPTTGLNVPMGLNVPRKSRRGENIGCSLGLVGGLAIGIAGPLTTILAFDAGVAGGVIAGVLGGGGLAAYPYFICRLHRFDQLAYKFEFTYAKQQNLAIPPLSTTLIHPDASKEDGYFTKSSKRSKFQYGGSVSDQLSASSFSKPKKSRGDLAKKIAGLYYGSGQLLINKRVDETYPDISIEITPIDKTQVKLTIIEDGEEFFNQPLILDVHTDKNGYNLTSKQIPSMIITITHTGNISFLHPKVYMEDQMYTLKCSAKKK